MTDSRSDRGGSEAIGAAVGSARAETIHAVVTWAIPIGIPVLAGLLVWLGGGPWGLVLTAAALAFGGITTGLLRFDEWLERRRIEGKLEFVAVRSAIKADSTQVKLGVHLHNRSASRIDCEILGWHTRLQDRVPKVTTFEVTRIAIPPFGDGWFDDHFIEVGELPKSGALTGLLDFRLRYGRANAPTRYELDLKKQVAIAFDESGTALPAAYHDAA
jgi:hypothetical protein